MLAANTIVAAAQVDAPGVLACADLDEDAAFCSVRLAWPRGLRAVLVMFDRLGGEVGRRDLGPGSRVAVFLCRGQFLSFRLFLRLYNGNALRGKSLITRILP